MAQEIRIPRLGWSMEEGIFQGWLKQDGAPVTSGEPLFELEGEKALQEIEAVDDGILCITPDAPQPGTVLSVGTIIGYLLAEGESPANVMKSAGAAESETAEPVTNIPTSVSSFSPPAPPSVRRLARELGVSLSTIDGTGHSGRITPEDVRAQSRASMSSPVRPARRKNASPRARRIAKVFQIDWTQIEGTGARGRVREADVRLAAQKQIATLTQQNALSMGADSTGPTLLPLSGRRRVIADRMRISHERTVPVTLTAVADASQLVGIREQFKRVVPADKVPSYTEMVVCLVAAVLRQHRRLAARWNNDQSGLEIPGDEGFHIGIAVDSPEGLLVPILHNVGRSSLEDIVSRARNLIDRARAGTLTAAEMQGGVFTVTNLGSYGIDAFTPVINFPETAILGLGEIRRQAVRLSDERSVPAYRMTLSFTFDHCAIDGAPAAACLRDLRHALENPVPQLLKSASTSANSLHNPLRE